MTASAIYEGRVGHRRSEPVERAFSYRHFMFYLDLDEVEEAMARHPLYGTGRRRPFRFAREDYLGDPAIPLGEAVRGVVEAELGARPAGPVRVLTQLRFLGRCFNPVSFYYCFGPGGEQDLRAVVAEVTNTPWGERHAYVAPASSRGVRERFEKAMHVSPLMPMEQRYEIRSGLPGERLELGVANLERGRRVFEAGLSLERRPLDRRAMTGALLRYPPMSLAVPIRIYTRALRTRLAGVSWHSHPAKAGT